MKLKLAQGSDKANLWLTPDNEQEILELKTFAEFTRYPMAIVCTGWDYMNPEITFTVRQASTD